MQEEGMDGGGRKRIETRGLNLKEALEDWYVALLWLRAFYMLCNQAHMYTHTTGEKVWGQ